MSKTIRHLALLFAAQIVLVAVVWSFSGGSGNREATPFIKVDLHEADSVTIDGIDGKVTLVKTENGWILPDYGQLTAVESKLEEAITKLSDITVRWPASVSQSAHTRFQVADDNAQKTVTFAKGDKTLATLRLGTSPGYRKVNARLDDQKEVYALDFSQHDLPGKQEDWFDRSLLKFNGTVTGVKTDKFTLTKAGDQWQVSTIDDNSRVDSEAVSEWVERFPRLTVTSRVSDDSVEEVTMQNPLISVEVIGTDATGAELSHGYAFYKNFKRGEVFFVKRFGDEHLFEIPKYAASPIVEIDPATFVKEAEASDGAAEAAATDQAVNTEDASEPAPKQTTEQKPAP